jgi:hypothetical protein
MDQYRHSYLFHYGLRYVRVCECGLFH